MRIRKRFPPSSLSSVPPNGNHLRVPQVDTHDSHPSDPPTQPLPLPPSDHKRMIGHVRAGFICSDAGGTEEKKELEGEELRDERWREKEIKRNDTTRKESFLLGAEEGGTDSLPPSSSSSSHLGDTVIPFKKRRVLSQEVMGAGAKMKSKTNKKCVKENSEEVEEGKESKIEKKNANKRGNVIMEGQRCSRVNGRGWRCSQQTLMGYSLCEHHLGKGRLRSITSVRRIVPQKGSEIINERLSSSPVLLERKEEKKILMLDDNEEDDDEDGKRKKTMMKIRMVKARSISSLLGQTENEAVVADYNKNRS